MAESKNSMGQGLIDKIVNALDKLTTLEIVTVVGRVQKDGGKDGALGVDWSADPKVMLSKINVLMGDITTSIDPEFVTGNYQSLRDFHAKREAQGYQIIQDNIQAIKELLGLAKILRGEEEQGAADGA